MTGFGVKITTINKLLDTFTPYYCRGCGRIGVVVCECCKNYISSTNMNCCPNCHKTFLNVKCNKCRLGFDGTFMVGWYDELIGLLVKEYKYNSVRSLAEVFADLFDDVLPIFKEKIVLVPLPTISKHIRQRGLDHVDLIAKMLAKKRDYRVERCLIRNKNSIQVGATSEMRRKQAKEAYKIKMELDPGTTYLLLDDVWTTGASMKEAAKIMKENGARSLIMAVLAVNRGDDKRS